MQGLVDQVLTFVSPKLLCDETGVPAVRGLVCETIAKARGLQLRDVKRFGDDVMLDYRPVR
jgi:riboflavin biosynthesis pyrimidine reductase